MLVSVLLLVTAFQRKKAAIRQGMFFVKYLGVFSVIIIFGNIFELFCGYFLINVGLLCGWYLVKIVQS